MPEFDPLADTSPPPEPEPPTKPGHAIVEPEGLKEIAAADLLAMHRRIDGWLKELMGPTGLLEVLGARVAALEKFTDDQRTFQKGLRDVNSTLSALFLQLDQILLKDDRLRGRTVLVVDDDVVICRFLRRMLEAKGAIILVATDAFQLKEKVKRHRINIDCVLLDVRLGVDDDGFTLAAWLIEENGFSNQRIILMTGHLTDEHQARAEALKIRVLEKPFTSADMFATIVGSLNEPAGHHPDAAR